MRPGWYRSPPRREPAIATLRRKSSSGADERVCPNWKWRRTRDWTNLYREFRGVSTFHGRIRQNGVSRWGPVRPTFFLNAITKLLYAMDLTVTDCPVLPQNIESMELRAKIFGISKLSANSSDIRSLTTMVRFGQHVSMTVLFSFCVLGQGYASQRSEKNCGKGWIDRCLRALPFGKGFGRVELISFFVSERGPEGPLFHRRPEFRCVGGRLLESLHENSFGSGVRSWRRTHRLEPATSLSQIV